MIDKGDILSIQYKIGLRGSKSVKKVDGLSLVVIYFYVPALTPCLCSTEISLKLAEKKLLFAICHIQVYRCRQQRPRMTGVWGVSFIYIYMYTVQCEGQDGTL
jgi:hypothetical protein